MPANHANDANEEGSFHSSRRRDSRADFVVFDARMLAHSGVGTHIRGVLGALTATESAPPITLLGGSPAIREAVPAATEKWPITPWTAPIYGWREQVEALRRRTEWARGGAERSERRFAVFHSPHYNFPLAWRGPMVVTVHDLIHIEHPSRAAARYYQTFMLRALRRRLARADRGGAPTLVVTGARHVKVMLQTLWRFPAHRVRVVGEGVGDGFRPPASEQEHAEGIERTRAEVTRTAGSWLPGEFWLAVGIHKPHKRFDWLLDRLGETWRRGDGEGVGLVVAGTRRDPALVRRVEGDERLRERVVILPEMLPETLRGLYWGARALLFPSLAEGFGLPVAEAMACGTPIVCSRRPPMTEIAEGAAWFFEPDDGHEFAEALRAARRENSQAAHRISTGLARARDMTWPKVAAGLLEAWRETCAEREGSREML